MQQRAGSFVHVLLFACAHCGDPVPSAIKTDESNVDQVDIRTLSIRCGNRGWSGKLMGTEAKRHWVGQWDSRHR